MDVSIIIVNYNTYTLTKECIDSIFERTENINFEIILVDNASTDCSKCMFETDDRIRYIYSNENLGFGRGNNLGYRYAKGKYIFLLNSDTVLINNAIEKLVSFMNLHPEIAIVGGALYNSNAQQCHSYGLLLPSLRQEVDNLFRGFFTKHIRARLHGDLQSYGYAEVAYITGADMMLRKDRIEDIGLFDPDFFMYYEETEMSLRYKTHGYISVFYPDAKIYHFEGKSFTFKETREKLFLTSRKLYYKKAGHNGLYYFASTVVYTLYLVTSIIKDLCLFKYDAAKNSYKKIMAVFKYA